MSGRAASAPPRARPRPRARDLLLAAAALALALGAAEGLVRLVAPQTLGLWRSMRDGLVTLRPGLRNATSALGTRVSTNALGMRDAPREFARAPGTTRVLVLGDSFVEALQVELEDAFSARLADALRAAAGTPVEVVTAGVSGWGTDDQLRWYRSVGSRFEVDVVLVMMTLHNDVTDNLELEFSRFEGGRVEPRTEPLPLPAFAALQIKGFLASHSHLYRLATDRLRRGRVAAQADALRRDVDSLLEAQASARMARGWELTESLLEAFRREARARGAELVVGLIPLAAQVAPDGAPDAPQATLRAWGARSGTLVVDLLPAFLARRAEAPGDALYLAGDGHWTREGHALAAEAIAPALAARLARPPSATPAAPVGRDVGRARRGAAEAGGAEDAL